MYPSTAKALTLALPRLRARYIALPLGAVFFAILEPSDDAVSGGGQPLFFFMRDDIRSCLCPMPEPRRQNWHATIQMDGSFDDAVRFLR